MHRCNVIFLKPKNFFPSTYVCPPPQSPTLIFLLWGIHMERYRDGAINNRTKGQREKVRERHLIEERGFFSFFFCRRLSLQFLCFFFRFAEHLSGSKTSQTEGENHKSMIFPLVSFFISPFQLSPQQLCWRNSTFWFSAHWLLLKHQQHKTLTIFILVEISFLLPNYD